MAVKKAYKMRHSWQKKRKSLQLFQKEKTQVIAIEKSGGIVFLFITIISIHLKEKLIWEWLSLLATKDTNQAHTIRVKISHVHDSRLHTPIGLEAESLKVNYLQ